MCPLAANDIYRVCNRALYFSTQLSKYIQLHFKPLKPVFLNWLLIFLLHAHEYILRIFYPFRSSSLHNHFAILYFYNNSRWLEFLNLKQLRVKLILLALKSYKITYISFPGFDHDFQGWTTQNEYSWQWKVFKWLKCAAKPSKTAIEIVIRLNNKINFYCSSFIPERDNNGNIEGFLWSVISLPLVTMVWIASSCLYVLDNVK